MEDKLIAIINIILESRDMKRVESISPQDNLRDDLGFTSFDLAELTVRIEDEFDIDIFEDGLVMTIGEVYQKLKK